jgi:hypothetical protein
VPLTGAAVTADWIVEYAAVAHEMSARPELPVGET